MDRYNEKSLQRKGGIFDRDDTVTILSELGDWPIGKQMLQNSRKI
jgi:hypothetical protein